jgi:hypothetical protein
MWLGRPCGFGSLGACPGHSSTVIAASSAPNSLRVKLLYSPDSECVNAATRGFVPLIFQAFQQCRSLALSGMLLPKFHPVPYLCVEHGSYVAGRYQ